MAQETKTTKIMRWVLTVVFGLAILIGVAAGLTGGEEEQTNHEQSAPAASASW